MRIRVTQDHIDRGWPMRCESCPVALAIMDAARADKVAVNGVIARVKGVEYVLPVCVTNFVARFDSVGSVQPFEFDLPIPQEHPATEDQTRE